MSYFSLPLAITCMLLWVYLLVPIALRLFGVHAPLAFQKRIQVLRTLGVTRFVSSYGVLTCGMAALIFFASNAFFSWRFSEAWTLGFVPAPFNSAWRMLLIVVTCVALGVFLALLVWNRPSSKTSSL
jgi:hypothetical protein